MRHLDLKALGQTVARKRKAAKLSQAALAKQAGINRSLLSRLEGGEYSPSGSFILASQVLKSVKPN